MKDTPIFICAKDRVTMLDALLRRLRDQGYGNIIIIDTGSKWPAMVEYLNGVGYPVHHVAPKLRPHMALWEMGVLKESGYMGRRYVYTDCDVVPDEGCPDDWIGRLWELLDKYPKYIKTGLGLRIDDLPGHYMSAAKAQQWESRFWKKEIEPDVFEADIDTTLALYREGCSGFGLGLRTGFPYVASHLPWYVNSKCLTEEELYYNLHRKEGHW